ncbi:RCC1 domain-containing protein [Microbacterium enclense]|uniref:RCC1 domain-containing protein n=1 Tax=Microbacterium enclense TaxID=993073 RepID=UPI003424FB9B
MGQAGQHHRGLRKLYCWGDNAYGQLGNGTSTSSRQPTLVAGLTGVTSVSVGYLHACAIAGGRLYCWGQNGSGAVGDGTVTNRTSPTLVPLAGATRVAAGALVGLSPTVTELRTTSYGACATTSATVQCWGSNGNGEVGDGTTTDRWTPTQIVQGDIPPAYSCVAAWTVVGSRCAPGPTVAVTYRVAHTVAGWSPPAPLTLVARP